MDSIKLYSSKMSISDSALSSAMKLRFESLISSNSIKEQLDSIHLISTDACNLKGEAEFRYIVAFILDVLLNSDINSQVKDRLLRTATLSCKGIEANKFLHKLLKAFCLYSSYLHNLNETKVKNLIYLLKDISSSSHCLLDISLTCGQIIVNLVSHCCCITAAEIFSNVVEKKHYFVEADPAFQLYLCHGILSTVSGLDLFKLKTHDGAVFIKEIGEYMFSLYEPNNELIVLVFVRSVYQWILRIKDITNKTKIPDDFNFSAFNSIFNKLSNCIFHLWDYYIDKVQHLIREIFVILVSLQMKFDKEESIKQYTTICLDLMAVESKMKMAYSITPLMIPYIGASVYLQYFPYPSELLLNLKDPSLSSVVFNILVILCKFHIQECSITEWRDFWFSSLFFSFSKEMLAYGFEILLKKILFTDFSSIPFAVNFLKQNSSVIGQNYHLLLILCIKIARCSPLSSKGFLCDLKGVDSQCSWKNLTTYSELQSCLFHFDENVQIATFGLICESPKSTELFEEAELHLLKKFYVYSLSSQSLPFNQNVIRFSKKLFFRIITGLNFIKKRKICHDYIKNVNIFCGDIFIILLSHIYESNNLCRQSTSIQILDLFVNIVAENISEFDKLCISSAYVDTLFNFLHSSFKDNKTIALDLLCKFSRHNLDEVKYAKLLNAFLSMASSFCPSDVLTASFIIRFLASLNEFNACVLQKLDTSSNFQCDSNIKFALIAYLFNHLEREIAIAKCDLLKSAASGPMYGMLASLRGILVDLSKMNISDCNFLKFIFQKIYELSFIICGISTPVICSSSPEGYLPVKFSHMPNNKVNDSAISDKPSLDCLVKIHSVSAQILLLCAWRCSKEAAFLLTEIVSFELNCKKELLSLHQIENIGNYFLNLLCETKHRGAFEQVAIGFVKFCSLLWECDINELHLLPEKWLREVLMSILSGKELRFSATRRSAGIPFIFQSILITEPSSHNSILLNEVMSTLLELVLNDDYDGCDAKIHSFNILRIIFRNAKLGEKVVMFCGKGVIAAVSGYKSNIWAVYNSASLFFSALIHRMFGLKHATGHSTICCMPVAIFFDRFLDLFDFIKHEIQHSAAAVKTGYLTHSLYPILMVLSKLTPVLSERSTLLSIYDLVPYLIDCLSCSIFHIRVLAARALCSFININNYIKCFETLCAEASFLSQNKLHGILLAFCNLVDLNGNLLKENCDVKDSLLLSLKKLVSFGMSENNCYVTRAYYFQFLIKCVDAKLIKFDENWMKRLVNSCHSIILTESDILEHPGGILCLQKMTLFYVKALFHENILFSLKLFLSSSYTEVKQEVLKFLNSEERCAMYANSQNIDIIFNIKRDNWDKKSISLLEELMNKYLVAIDASKYEFLCATLIEPTLQKILEEKSPESIITAVQLCSTLVQNFYQGLDVEFCIKWLECLRSVTLYDNNAEVRLCGAKEIAKLAAVFYNKDNADNLVIQYLELVFSLLWDDDKQIREVMYFGTSSAFSCTTYSVSELLEIILKKMISVNEPLGTTAVVRLAFSEDDLEDDSDVLDDDRVFDKGEVNLFKEPIYIAEIAAHTIKKCILDKGNLRFSEDVIAYVCSPNASLCIKEILDSSISLSDFVHILVNDINFILTKLCNLKNLPLFSIRSSSLWLKRLYIRAIFYEGITSACKEQAINTQPDIALLENLKESCLKPQFMLQIIDMLER